MKNRSNEPEPDVSTTTRPRGCHMLNVDRLPLVQDMVSGTPREGGGKSLPTHATSPEEAMALWFAAVHRNLTYTWCKV